MKRVSRRRLVSGVVDFVTPIKYIKIIFIVFRHLLTLVCMLFVDICSVYKKYQLNIEKNTFFKQLPSPPSPSLHTKITPHRRDLRQITVALNSAIYYITSIVCGLLCVLATAETEFIYIRFLILMWSLKWLVIGGLP